MLEKKDEITEIRSKKHFLRIWSHLRSCFRLILKVKRAWWIQVDLVFFIWVIEAAELPSVITLSRYVIKSHKTFYDFQLVTDSFTLWRDDWVMTLRLLYSLMWNHTGMFCTLWWWSLTQLFQRNEFSQPTVFSSYMENSHLLTFHFMMC